MVGDRVGLISSVVRKSEMYRWVELYWSVVLVNWTDIRVLFWCIRLTFRACLVGYTGICGSFYLLPSIQEAFRQATYHDWWSGPGSNQVSSNKHTGTWWDGNYATVPLITVTVCHTAIISQQYSQLTNQYLPNLPTVESFWTTSHAGWTAQHPVVPCCASPARYQPCRCSLNPDPYFYRSWPSFYLTSRCVTSVPDTS
jgi:hypothetical protein